MASNTTHPTGGNGQRPAGQTQWDHMASGSVLGFLGSAISLPTGLVTAAFLSRQLGPDQYGILTVVCYIVFFAETTVTLGFERAAVKLTAETPQWEDAAANILRIQLIMCIAIAGMIAFAAPMLSNWMHTDTLTFYLRVYAVGIPISGLAQIHTAILVGLGRFRERAWLNGGYWLVRLLLVVIFVWVRPSVTAVLFANMASVAFVLMAARRTVKPPIFIKRHSPGLRGVWDTAWPLYLFTLCIILSQRMDLIFVRAKAGPDVAGFYAAAKNLSVVPVLITAAMTPVLLSKLSFLLSENRTGEAGSLLERSRHFVVCLLPFAGMSAGAASEVASLVYGRTYLPSGPLLAVLIFGALGLTLTQINAAGLIAAGRSKLPLTLLAPILPMAVAAHSLLIPIYGAPGAAGVTAAVSAVTAVLTYLAANHVWRTSHGTGLWVKSLGLTGLVFWVSALWHTPGLLVVGKLLMLATGIVGAYWISGDFNLHRQQWMVQWFGKRM